MTKSWAKTTIWALFGNMEKESGMNPGAWQSGSVKTDYTTLGAGYGLVQWDPSAKYLTNNYSGNWDRGTYANSSIIGQLKRILFEVPFTLSSQGAQWLKPGAFPSCDRAASNIGIPTTHTFSDFTKSNLSVEALTKMFLIYYERSGEVVAFGKIVNPTKKEKEAFEAYCKKRTDYSKHWERLVTGQTSPGKRCSTQCMCWDYLG